MTHIRIDQLWRYPVKSLQGERLDTADLTRDGVSGDRLVHVAGPRGPLTGRTRHGLLTLRATTGADGAPWIEGHRWDSEEAARLVADRGGVGARLVADGSSRRFDVLNLMIATDGAVARLGHDVRRLRPNLVLSGVPSELEPELPGRAVRVGTALIGFHSVRQRCIVTTIDPDSGAQDLTVLRRIRDEFGGEIALNSWVIEPGTVSVGDRAELTDTTAVPADLGGWIVGRPYPHAG